MVNRTKVKRYEEITIDFLLEELEILLGDEFVCHLDNDGKNVYMTFVDGQKFCFSVTECK